MEDDDWKALKMVCLDEGITIGDFIKEYFYKRISEYRNQTEPKKTNKRKGNRKNEDYRKQ